MNEGWHGDDYLILFEGFEILAAENRYGFAKFLPGYRLIGLCGWDDFIVRDEAGHFYSIPTVPIDPQFLEPFTPPQPEAKLVSDPKFAGKIKWYVQPIVLGGDPKAGENLTWVTHEQHGQLVQWWNEKYRSVVQW